MKKKNNNNTIILEGCIQDFKSQNDLLHLSDSEIFELFSLSQITKNLDISYENISNSITDGGNDGGIDSVLIFINDIVYDAVDDISVDLFTPKTTAKFIFTQCKKENSFKESSIDKLITSFPVLFNLGESEASLLSRFNPTLIEKVNIAKYVWQKTATTGGVIEIEINYACNAEDDKVSQAFKSKKNQLEEACKNIFSTESVRYFNFSSRELLRLFQTHKKNRLTLEFRETPLYTNYGENGIGYIGMVKLSQYRNFITSESNEIREDLFESNVRHYQGGVDVNKKIQNTLASPSNKDFWWLNNGITIIAESPNQIGKKLSLENVQIVNGLQTSYCIYKAYKNIKNDDRAVLVKVIINSDKEIIDDIIESTNYQNAISPGLLKATEDLQRNIEIFFLSRGYFYDRRKNYYKNQGKPASRIYGILYTAQAMESIIGGEPHTARSAPASLLKKETIYSSIFRKDNNINVYLNCCIIVSKIQQFILKIPEKSKKSMISNFKLHLSWISSIVYLKNINITADVISNLDMASLDISKYMEFSNRIY